MVVKYLPEYRIYNGAMSDLIITGDVMQIRHMPHKNSDSPIEKIDVDHYRIKATGEIKEYSHIENRSQSANSLRQTFNKIKDDINCNVRADNKNKCLFVTLTYRQDNGEPMTDPEKLLKDFNRFQTNFRYKWCKAHGYNMPEYISIVEPQSSGAWHCHVIFIFDKKPFVANTEINRMWGQGFVKVNALDSVDNVGAYLVAYLSDIPINEYQEAINTALKNKTCSIYDLYEPSKNKPKNLVGKKLTIKEKKYVKGGRTCLYPPNFKIYRHSRGIKKPEKERMPYIDCIKKVSDVGAPLTYSSNVEIQLSDGFITTIANRYYNKAKKNTQAIIGHDLVDTETGDILIQNYI